MPAMYLEVFRRVGHSEPRPGRVEEVPGRQDKSENRESVCHPRVTAVVDLPTAPKGDGGSDDHENTAEGVQWTFLMRELDSNPREREAGEVRGVFAEARARGRGS